MSENKTKQSTYKTIGIRFASNPSRVYTYRVRSGAKLKLGDEVILDGCGGPAVGYVVRLDRTPQDTEGYEYKYVTRRVAPL